LPRTSRQVDRFYEQAENMVDSTNEKVKQAKAIMAGLRADGLLTPEPFDEPIEFVYFDYWHYYGRTARHGAYMGGADFVQWHGNYELLAMRVEMREMEREIRHRHEQQSADAEDGEQAAGQTEAGGYDGEPPRVSLRTEAAK
jgi:hypothetical protein